MLNKIDITPNDALLILIREHQKQAPVDHYLLNIFKKLLIQGLTKPYKSLEKLQNRLRTFNKAETIQVLEETLFHSPYLTPYHIVFDEASISEDPTRRYFESLLCHNILTYDLDNLSLLDLQTHYNLLYSLTIEPTLLWISLNQGDDVVNLLENEQFIHKELLVLDGQFDELLEQKIEEEYPESAPIMYEFADMICKTKRGTLFSAQSTEEREKIALLLKCAFIGVHCENFGPPVPIYGRGLFAKEIRGAAAKRQPILQKDRSNKTEIRSHNAGLLKSYQALSPEDVLYHPEGFRYIKSADRTQFVPDSPWVTMNFSHFIYPFSNSISGTMLIQLRCLVELRGTAVIFVDKSPSKVASSYQHKNCFSFTHDENEMQLTYITPFLTPRPLPPMPYSQELIDRINQIRTEQGSNPIYLSHEQMIDLIPHWQTIDPKRHKHTAPFATSAESMAQFIRPLVSTLLVATGGHSLYEYTAPLQSSAIKRSFSSMPNYDSELSMTSLFYDKVPVAFEKALAQTLIYQEKMLLQKQLALMLARTYAMEQRSGRARICGIFDQNNQRQDYLPFLKRLYQEKMQELKDSLRIAQHPYTDVLIPIADLEHLSTLIEEQNFTAALAYLATLPTDTTKTYLQHAARNAKKLIQALERKLTSLAAILSKINLTDPSRELSVARDVDLAVKLT